ncbi:hypothetical protein MMC34_002546 [Xylographa carneopallida]|nr:hypothetical protein [Xylographa carneopallida]
MDDYDSNISSGCMLYPVFYTADIKADILDNLITNSRKGLLAILGGDSAALYFLDSKPGVPINAGCHRPMKAFHSSWIGKSLSQIYRHFKADYNGINNEFCNHTFAILDEETAANGTMLLVTDRGGSLVTQRSDFYCSLHELVPMEMVTRAVETWKKHEVVTREMVDRESEDYRAAACLKQEKEEPLNKIERKIIGVWREQ